MAIRFPNRTTRDTNVQASQTTRPAQALDTSAYAAPRTEIVQLTDYHGNYNDSKFYSWDGRIGRVQFFAYPVMFMCAAMIIFMLAFMAMGGAASLAAGSVSDSLSGTLGILMGLLMIAVLYIQFASTKRRLNDLNKSGWFSLLLFLPFVSTLLALYLMIVKGDAGNNDYGLPPAPPNKATIIAALVVPFFVFSGFAAAIALPAYDNYVKKQQAARDANETTVVTNHTEKTQNVTVASTTVATAPQNASAPLPSPEAQVAAAMANQPANPPVITQSETVTANADAAQPSVVAAPAPMPETPTQNNNRDEQAATKSSSSEVAFANDTSGKSNTDIGTSSKQSMSYAEFIKTSENVVYADR